MTYPIFTCKQLGIALLMALTCLIVGTTATLAQDPDVSADGSPTPFLPDTPYNYSNIALPNHFNDVVDLDNTPNNNPTTDYGATLGRVLFYDTKLSVNDTISCASCHQQANGFADPDRFSTGFAGGLTGRNSPGLANARFFEPGTYFWDERASSLEAQVLMPIQDPVEMGMNLSDLETKLAAESYYPPLFQNAFGRTEVTSDRISKALAQFVRAMISYQSKYDEGRVSNFGNFTPEEDRGRRIFEGRGRCDNCHTTAAFVAEESHNIGLDATTTDEGLGGTTNNNNDDGKFKVTSLRNIALTAPYMHDGRFNTLAAVIEHYNSGVQNHPNLDNQLEQNGQPRRLNLNQDEKEALEAFLHTLTDSSFTHDGRFSTPFITVTNVVYLPIIVR